MKLAPLLGEGLTLPITPQHFHEVEVTYHKLQIKREFELSFIGDTHYGSQECIEPFVEYAYNRIERRKNSAAIHMGDAGEFNDRDSPANAIHEQKHTNQEIKDYLIERLRPMKEKWWCWMGANHDDERSRNKVGTSQSRDICQAIDIPYSRISCYHIIDFNNHRLTIYTNHGKRRATPTWRGTKTKIHRESLIYPVADIVAIGHIHKLRYEDIVPDDNVTEQVVIDYENMCMTTRPAEFDKLLITGHFLKYLGGYGQKDGYPPNPAGYPILKLHPNGCYDVEFIWERDFQNGVIS